MTHAAGVRGKPNRDRQGASAVPDPTDPGGKSTVRYCGPLPRERTMPPVDTHSSQPLHTAHPDGPLAYFITFRTYGTWLHGDSRGSIDPQHNTPDTPPLAPNAVRESWELARMHQPPLILGGLERAAVSTAIEEVCQHRGWGLSALNVRSNHVHAVLSGAGKPELLMGTLKSWSTRALRAQGLVAADRMVWVRHGSTRYLWTEADVEAACAYVLEGQGDVPADLE